VIILTGAGALSPPRRAMKPRRQHITTPARYHRRRSAYPASRPPSIISRPKSATDVPTP